jgi:hypothetical protein
MVRQLFDGLHTQFPDAFAYGFPGTRPYRLGEYAGLYECIELAAETRITPAPVAPRITTRPAPLVSAEVDRLWRRLKGRFSLSLTRDSAYLNWRYAQHPSEQYRRVNFFSWGRLIGWSILRAQEDKTQIIDVFCSPSRLREVIAAAAFWLAKENKPPAVVWLPERLRGIAHGDSILTEVHTTNMVRGFAISTLDARRALYYTMGDLDIF